MDKNNQQGRICERAHQWPEIVVEVDGSIVTTAVAVFEHSDGLAWVEPHYIDPWATRPAYHGIVGRLSWDRSEGYLEGHRRCVIRAPLREEDGVFRATRAWREWLEKQGRSVVEERARLLEEVSPLDLEGAVG